ncbi:hypothetical protein DLAC_04435 [Tieghemostelium lacteum]|uniref:Carbohydrate binding domain-containing protein n=1 Tax=Tieghemostelium lacteum TaxID=361077 RepID=A0A151ZJR8_TIELA|nr:hypothetical protein DLAC_04435 [Tieghemostelium lacteum]|eukprot:KYQ94149.1 hypothetical protein DLAC_04435 [Tieghemostelium lacteum]
MLYKSLFVITVVFISIGNALFCERETKGFTSNVGIFSVNGYDIGQNGPSTYVEFSNITIDYKGVRLYSSYFITEGVNQFSGQMYAFNENKTVYIVVNGECSQLDLNFEIPVSLPKNESFVGIIKLGKFDTIGLEFTDFISPGTKSLLLYDDVKCAIVSITTENTDITNPGYSITNYYNFDYTPTYSDFQIPSECFYTEKSEDIQNSVRLPHVIDPFVKFI